LKTEAMSLFEHHIYLASNKEEFGNRIEKALIENTPENEMIREMFAREHSIENNVKKIYEAMERVMGNQSKTSF